MTRLMIRAKRHWLDISSCPGRGRGACAEFLGAVAECLIAWSGKLGAARYPLHNRSRRGLTGPGLAQTLELFQLRRQPEGAPVIRR